MSAMFEKDLETFKASPDTWVIATFNASAAHVILWADEKGYTVSEWTETLGYSQGSRCNGGAVSLGQALEQFNKAVARIAAPIIHFDKLHRELMEKKQVLVTE